MSLKRNTPLKPGKRIKPTNTHRRAESYARNYGDRGELARSSGCIVGNLWEQQHPDTYPELLEAGWTPCKGDVQAMHVVPRQKGGHGPGDRRKLVGGCAQHSDEAGEGSAVGRTPSKRAAFEKRYTLDVMELAAELAADGDARGLS